MYKLNLLTSLTVCILSYDCQIKGLLNEQRKLSWAESYDKANIFLGLIEYELNSLLGASHLVDYISVHIRFDLERYLLNITHDFCYFRFLFGPFSNKWFYSNLPVQETSTLT